MLKQGAPKSGVRGKFRNEFWVVQNGWDYEAEENWGKRVLCRGCRKGVRGESAVCLRDSKWCIVDGFKTTWHEMKLKPDHKGPSFS